MSNKQLPAAVLWDMDGTLIDSEPYWLLSETRLASDYGSTWSSADGHQLIGMNLYESSKLLRAKFSIEDLSDQEIIDRLTGDVVAQLRQALPWRPGALELLTELKARGVKTALVTMSMRNMAQLVADQIEFAAFDALVCGDEVTNGKPHPEPYLRACEALGVDPRETVALEDSNTGARSAIAAGCLTIGIPNIVPITEPEARLVTSLSDVTVDTLAEMLSGR
jgi:HAD superfamily hydrolase (TIGR01509 family)